MGDGKDLLENLSLELRRGTLTLCVLSQRAEKKYGYALVQSLEEKGVSIDPNTLYPLLRRLEGQGLLAGWAMLSCNILVERLCREPTSYSTSLTLTDSLPTPTSSSRVRAVPMGRR